MLDTMRSINVEDADGRVSVKFITNEEYDWLLSNWIEIREYVQINIGTQSIPGRMEEIVCINNLPDSVQTLYRILNNDFLTTLKYSMENKNV